MVNYNLLNLKTTVLKDFWWTEVRFIISWKNLSIKNDIIDAFLKRLKAWVKAKGDFSLSLSLPLSLSLSHTARAFWILFLIFHKIN